MVSPDCQPPVQALEMRGLRSIHWPQKSSGLAVWQNTMEKNHKISESPGNHGKRRKKNDEKCEQLGNCGTTWKHDGSLWKKWTKKLHNWESHHLTFLRTFQDFDAGAKFQASLSGGLSGEHWMVSLPCYPPLIKGGWLEISCKWRSIAGKNRGTYGKIIKK